MIKFEEIENPLFYVSNHGHLLGSIGLRDFLIDEIEKPKVYLAKYIKRHENNYIPIAGKQINIDNLWEKLKNESN